MDWPKFFLEVHFASPLLMATAAALFVTLYMIVVRRSRNPVSHSYLAFFHKALAKKRPDPLLWMYRKLPYTIAFALILAVGNPMREGYETRAQKMVPYSVYLDSSGSLASFNAQGKPSLDFTDSLLNIARLSLIKFSEERKDTCEFFLVLYSDTPYLARYFAGGKEASIQIGGFLETLPQDIKKWQGTSRAFYLQGTNTAFALEAGMRYRTSLPASLRESVFLLITDLEDTQIWRVAGIIDALIESGPRRGVYVVALSSASNDERIVAFENSLKHKEVVHIFRAHDQASLDLALRTIGEGEDSSEDISLRVLRSKSLQRYLIFGVIFFALLYIGIGEFYVRKIP